MQLTDREIEEIADRALSEDAAFDDVTSRTIVPEGTELSLRMVTRQSAVICGPSHRGCDCPSNDPRSEDQCSHQRGRRSRNRDRACPSSRGRAWATCRGTGRPQRRSAPFRNRHAHQCVCEAKSKARAPFFAIPGRRFLASAGSKNTPLASVVLKITAWTSPMGS